MFITKLYILVTRTLSNALSNDQKWDRDINNIVTAADNRDICSSQINTLSECADSLDTTVKTLFWLDFNFIDFPFLTLHWNLNVTNLAIFLTIVNVIKTFTGSKCPLVKVISENKVAVIITYLIVDIPHLRHRLLNMVMVSWGVQTSNYWKEVWPHCTSGSP